MAIGIEKLRPELLEKSPAELERLATEIAMAQAELARRAEVAAKEELAAEANRHVEAVLAGVKFLHDNGLLSERIAAAFSRGDGQFNPATFLRTVTAEQLVPRTARPTGGAARPAGEKRTRRVRDPKTGELVPSKASRRGV